MTLIALLIIKGLEDLGALLGWLRHRWLRYRLGIR